MASIPEDLFDVCTTCRGRGVPHRYGVPERSTRIPCTVCDGTGKVLKAVPELIQQIISLRQELGR